MSTIRNSNNIAGDSRFTGDDLSNALRDIELAARPSTDGSGQAASKEGTPQAALYNEMIHQGIIELHKNGRVEITFPFCKRLIDKIDQIDAPWDRRNELRASLHVALFDAVWESYGGADDSSTLGIVKDVTDRLWFILFGGRS